MAIKSKAKEAYDLGISYSAYKIAYDRGCTDTSEFLEKPNEELEEKIAEILGQYVNLKGQHKGRDAFIKEIRKLLEYRQPVQVDGELLSEITEVSVCHMIENGGVIHSKLKEEIRKLIGQDKWKDATVSTTGKWEGEAKDRVRKLLPQKPTVTREEIETFVYNLNQLPISVQGKELAHIFKSKGFEITDEVVG